MRVQARLEALHAASAVQVETTRSNAEAVATQRAHTLSREALESAERARQRLETTAQLLATHEASLRELEGHARVRDERLRRREAVVTEQAAQARTLKRTRHEALVARLARLAERAGASAETVRVERFELAIADGGAWVRKAAAVRDEARNLNAEATRLLEMICERYDGVGHLERLSSTFEVSLEIAAALADARQRNVAGAHFNDFVHLDGDYRQR